jgi:hypothetical protein
VLRSRMGDRGASALEYGGVLLLVAAIVIALTAVIVPNRIATDTRAAVCRMFGGSNCGAGTKPGTGQSPSPGTSSAGSGSPGTGPGTQTGPGTTSGVGDDIEDPTDPAYVTAQQRATKADGEANSAETDWAQIGKELLDFLADLVGITDAKNCITKGDIMGCLMTLVNVLPWGKIFKVLRKIPKAAKLIERFAKLLTRLNAARKEKLAADAAFRRIEDAIATKVDSVLAKLCTNSFVPGTLVLMADGRHRPIEQVRAGDLVMATDPRTGRSAAEPVTAAFGGTNYRALVSVTVAGSGTVTATEHHRFWDPRTDSWIRADQLTGASVLLGPDGSVTRVLGTRVTPGHPEVRDLTVAQLHTFYVLAGGRDVLVHNAGGCLAIRKLAGPGNRYQTPAGLVYKDGPNGAEHRLMHVLEHGRENPNKAVHSVFNTGNQGVLETVDEAWAKHLSVTPITQGSRQVYIIPMKRVVGTAGEKYVRIVVENGNEIVTAFPQATGHL